MSLSIVKLPPQVGISNVHPNNAVYRVDDCVNIRVFWNKNKQFTMCYETVHYSYEIVTVNVQNGQCCCTWYCSIKLYVWAALRVASHIGYDLKHAPDQDVTLWRLVDIQRLRNHTQFFYNDGDKKNLQSVILETELRADVNNQLRSLTQNVRYVRCFQSAEHVKTERRDSYAKSFEFFKANYDGKDYEIIVVSFKSKPRDGCVNFYIRTFGETAQRPKLCLNVSFYSVDDGQVYKDLITSTFYGTDDEDCVAAAILEKFGQQYDFGVLEQYHSDPYSLPDEETHLWSEGSWPLSQDEIRAERHQKREKENAERRARMLERDEKRKNGQELAVDELEQADINAEHREVKRVADKEKYQQQLKSLIKQWMQDE